MFAWSLPCHRCSARTCSLVFPALCEQFQSADRYDGSVLKPRGRPKAATTKEAVKLRLDADVLAALRASGDGWQTRINDALRASLALAGKLV